MDLAHVLLGQHLLVPGNLADAQGKTKCVQYCRPPLPTCLARAPAMKLGSTFCHHSDTEVSKHHLRFTGRAPVPRNGGVVLTRVWEKPRAWTCGATGSCWRGSVLRCCRHSSSLPDGGCLYWAPELLSVIFQPGCQPGKQSSQPKQDQVGRNRENGSNIPACRQRRFQSNGGICSR